MFLYDILSHNEKFVANKDYEKFQTSKYPDKKMVIVSCMDTRLVELLPQAMSIKNGDAKIIKTAGALILHPFGSAMRSVLVSVFELGAEEVFVVGHHGCGMSSIDSNAILEKIKQSGIPEETLNILNNAGHDLSAWFHGFGCVTDSVKSTAAMIKKHPLMPSRIKVHGLVIDPETGKLDIAVDGYKEI